MFTLHPHPALPAPLAARSSTAPWEAAAARRNRWLETLVLAGIAVYFVGGMLSALF